MARTTVATKKIVVTPLNARLKAEENQKQFWNRVGVTQSGGSRIESGRKMSKPVRMLLALSSGQATVEQLRSGELAELVS